MFFSYFLLFFTISDAIEHARLKLALFISTGTPMAAANDAIEMLPVVTDKAINDFQDS